MEYEYTWRWENESNRLLVGYVVPSNSGGTPAVRFADRCYVADYRTGDITFRFGDVSLVAQYQYLAVDVLREPVDGSLRVLFSPQDITFISESGASVKKLFLGCADADVIYTEKIQHVITCPAQTVVIDGEIWVVGRKTLGISHRSGNLVTCITKTPVNIERCEHGLRVMRAATTGEISIQVRTPSDLVFVHFPAGKGTDVFFKESLEARFYYTLDPICVPPVVFKPSSVVFADYRKASVTEYVILEPSEAFYLRLIRTDKDFFYYAKGYSILEKYAETNGIFSLSK